MRIGSDGTKYFGAYNGTRIQMGSSNETLYQYTNTYYIWGLYNDSNSLSIESCFAGDIIFRAQGKTTTSSPGTATERMRITSGGDINMNATSGNKLLTVKGQTGNGYYGEVRLGNADHSAGIRGIHNSSGNTDLIFLTEQYSGAGYTERMRITSGGGVGIGTTSVTGTYKCRVINSSAVNGDPLFAVDNNIYNGILVYSAGADGYNGAATVMVMGRNTSTSRSINAGGSINASGSDYAEYMIKAVEDTITKGDIVGVNENGLLTNIFADAKSFVVKSTDPSYVGGDTWGNIDDIGKLPLEPTEQEKADYEAKLEEARAKVDRIAFCGQVPCNVTGANVGDYIIPIELENGKIGGQAITNPTFEQYQMSVGKVWKIMEDNRAWIAVKIG